MSYILIIETSTERGVVAIAKDEEVVFSSLLPFGYQSSRTLFALLMKGFQELNITPSDLKYIAVGVGPGSFTGIRVGVAAAKGLAISQEIPLIGLNALQGFISSNEGRFASVIDARIGGAYCLIQENRQGKITTLSDSTLYSLDSLKEILRGCDFAVGPSMGRLALANSLEIAPDISHLYTLAKKAFAQKTFSVDGTLDLIYLRNSV